jgi:RNA polymerase sigma-70 factor (ECF subfamily)
MVLDGVFVLAVAHPLEMSIRALQGELSSFLRRKNKDRAEELTQEVWLRVTRARPEGMPFAEFRAYAYTVARRVLVDEYRRRSARVTLRLVEEAPDGTASSGNPQEHAQAAQMFEVVEAALAQLQPEVVEVFRLRTTTGLAFREIAERQGVPLNTALGRMHRAVKAIRASLQREGMWEEGPCLATN